MNLIDKFSKNNLFIGLPKLKSVKDKIYDACQKGKQVKTSFKFKNIVSTSRPLQLLHMDLIGPSKIRSHSGNYYVFVIVDNYLRYTWTLFLTNKSDTFQDFIKLVKIIQNKNGSTFVSLRNDCGGEFGNHDFTHFYS